METWEIVFVTTITVLALITMIVPIVLDWRSPKRWDGRYEKGHGVVPSAMQNDMMDRG